MAKRYGIPVATAHDALYDAFLTAQLLQRFLHFLPPAGVAFFAFPGTERTAGLALVFRADDALLRVELTASNGTLTLSGTAGLSFESGADGSAAMMIVGAESAIASAAGSGSGACSANGSACTVSSATTSGGASVVSRSGAQRAVTVSNLACPIGESGVAVVLVVDGVVEGVSC